MAAMSFDGFLAEFHRDEDKALKYLSTLVSNPQTSDDELESKKKEDTIMKVGSELAKAGKVDPLKRLIEIIRPYVVSLGKAKAAKIIRNLVDVFLDIVPVKPSTQHNEIKVGLCEDCVEWAKTQKRVFLRQTLESRLVRLFNDIERYPDALKLATALVKELKKVEDKDLIVEVQLEESKASFHLGNLAKARAALTSARTTANSIYIPPRIQAALDMQSGTPLIVEVQLEESKASVHLGNLAKARAALTSARTTANSIYIPPRIQAALDMQSGTPLIVEVQLEESKASVHLGNLAKARAALTSARTTANSIYIPPRIQATLDMQSGTPLIVEVQLEESKASVHLGNLAKARAALTSARTTANSIYIPPRIQAALDMQSGTPLIVEVQLEESKASVHLGNLAKARAALTSARTTANSIYIPPRIQAALDMQSGTPLIVEVQLEESKASVHLGNLAKARAALTSARTTANSIYIPPRTQAAFDMESGILHAADEKDFKTAFSYFYEAFEGYDSVDMKLDALRALKYMLLSKIMLNLPDDVTSILSGKLALKYEARSVDAMKAVAAAAKKRSLADFTVAFGRDFREERRPNTGVRMWLKELTNDAVVKSHFDALRDSMLEKNLSRIIEPYSRVQIEYVAEKIGLDRNQVERKLSQMILDSKISGILDQGEKVLVLYPEPKKDAAYEAALSHIKATDKLVDALHNLAKKLT